VRKATLSLTERKVPGAPLLVHKMIEARYRHHAALSEAARRHSGLPPVGGRPGIEALRHLDGSHPPSAPVALTPPEGIPAQAECGPDPVMAAAAAAPLATAHVDPVDESDDGLGDETAVTFR